MIVASIIGVAVSWVGFIFYIEVTHREGSE